MPKPYGNHETLGAYLERSDPDPHRPPWALLTQKSRNFETYSEATKFGQAQSFSRRVKGFPVIFETNFRQQTDRQIDRGFQLFLYNVIWILYFSNQFSSIGNFWYSCLSVYLSAVSFWFHFGRDYPPFITSRQLTKVCRNHTEITGLRGRIWSVATQTSTNLRELCWRKYHGTL